MRRKELLLDALVNRRMKHINGSQTPFTTFVKKLQESLTRMESFDVVTASQGSDGMASLYLYALHSINIPKIPNGVLLHFLLASFACV